MYTPTYVLNILLARVELFTQNERQTPVHYAAKYNCIETLKLLIKFHGNFIQKDSKEKTPLLLAAEQG